MKNLVLLLVLFSGADLTAQNLLTSRNTSYYTYIFKITDKEACKIYKNDLEKTDGSFFHTLVDSFPTDAKYIKKLPEGNYLRVTAEKNKLNVSIATVQNVEIKILNNHTDLCIQVFDTTGRIIDNARLSVHGKTLHFDKLTRCYTDKKSNRKGLLKLEHNGITSYYDLKRKYNNSTAKRIYGDVMYKTPLRYAWIPVVYAFRLPVDAVKSIRRGWAQGTIRATADFFRKAGERIGCIFDSYYCNENERFEKRHRGYLVFNKPKYMPGDTVKIKAFIVKRKGKPVNNRTEVVLFNGQKDIILTRLKPYRPGAYHCEFQLHDSLDLKLDRDYDITVRKSETKEYISKYFTYEDYELSNIKLTVRTDTDKQYKGKDYNVYVSGKDENDLNLLDARVELFIKPLLANAFMADHVFIPDTIYKTTHILDPGDETTITIPDSVFPEANLSYELQVTLLTSDNDHQVEKKTINYYALKREFEMSIELDSVYLRYLENGFSKPEFVSLYGRDNFGHETFIQKLRLPGKIPLNPYYAGYLLKSNNLEQFLTLENENSLIQCFSDRSPEGISILVENPRLIPFNYNLFSRNHEIQRGHGLELKFVKKIHSHRNYFISLQYLWAGQMVTQDFKIPLNDKLLHIDVKQPALLYPGQHASIELAVTDLKGKPVEGVDLTAYGLTRKFDYHAPDIPYLGKNRKNKTIINSFNVKSCSADNAVKLIGPEMWRWMSCLDSIEYYKFIYPKNSIYQYVYTPSNGITQFSPFALFYGYFSTIEVVYVDAKPVYFAWSTNDRPYSFQIDSGYHQVKLRTPYKTITIDSLYFPYKKKLIFSMDERLINRHVKIEKSKPTLTEIEKESLYRYIFPYSAIDKNRYAYIEQNKQVMSLRPSENAYGLNLAGPIAGTAITFQMVDGYTIHFDHEPFFQYEFNPGLLKMRSIDPKMKYPLSLYQPSIEGFSEEVATKNDIIREWHDFLRSQQISRRKYLNPEFTTTGKGKIVIDYVYKDSLKKTLPENILLFRHGNPGFIRIYPGYETEYHNLEEGLYKMVIIFPGSDYYICDSLNVRSHGYYHHKLIEPDHLIHDSFSMAIADIIDRHFLNTYADWQDAEKEIKDAHQEFFSNSSFKGEGDEVSGYVYEGSNNEPLPGVTVYITGTTFGTVTDANGFYSLKVPSYSSKLQFSFVGCKTETLFRPFTGAAKIILHEDQVHLDEIVVVGYGTTKRYSLTSSVASGESIVVRGLSSQFEAQLSGRLAGVSITGKNSRPDSLALRFKGADAEIIKSGPLYIVNGSIFNGDINSLDPETFETIKILKDAEAVAIYGIRGAKGVVIITLKAGIENKNSINGAVYDDAFLEAASQSSSIRKNFSDYGFWQPCLKTDKLGIARFDFTIPDDITSWDVNYLAMNNHRQSGQASGKIKSYKPLMAQLAVPSFLIRNDTLLAIGKVLNYTSDTTQLETSLEINDSLIFRKKITVEKVAIDTLNIVATGKDTLNITYFTKKEDGYFDGEQRKIDILPMGLEETYGTFLALDKDTTFRMVFDNKKGDPALYAKADVLDIIEDEVSSTITYIYGCNEQIASKLKALLAEKMIARYRGIENKHEFQIEKMIRLLEKNRKKPGLWGWWKESQPQGWISIHVLEALLQAEQMGYKINLDKEELIQNLVWELQNAKSFTDRISYLKILSMVNAPIDFGTNIAQLPHNTKYTLPDLLNLLELKQKCNLKTDLKILDSYEKKTLFGNIYFSEDTVTNALQSNNMHTTLLAYSVLRNDTLTDPEVLRKIRNYFLENRKNGFWRNTYESSLIVEAILPDLLKGKKQTKQPVLTISKQNSTTTIDKFPYESTLQTTDTITISKKGDFPVYFTAYQHMWNNSPEKKSGDFEINSGFTETTDSDVLESGHEVKLLVKVHVKKDADYVMIEIPVPAGCSYASKKNFLPNEVHREYFKYMTSIFCEHLAKGDYQFEIDLIPRYTGRYTLNPARVELMYFPVFNANNELRQVVVE